MTNPLAHLGDRLPAFDRISVADVEPGIRDLVTQVDSGIAALEAACGPTWTPSWDGLLTALHTVTEPLRLAWGVVNHLMGVQNSPELRAAHQAVQPEVVKLYLRLGQSPALYEALVRLRDARLPLSAPQQRILANEIRDMELSGVALTGAAKERYQAISLELSELGSRFSNQMLDANKAFRLDLTTTDEIAGLPPTLLAQAAALAGGTPEAGPWRITLDLPLYGPFMEHSRRGDLRERLYRAFITRASADPVDNQPVMSRILALRQELAALLGKGSHAEVSLSSKMAGTVAAVDELLDQLRAAAKPKAQQELADLTAYARSTSGDPQLTLNPWDVGFWAERLREERYAYTDEELRPYLRLPQVLAGLFSVIERLFGISVRPADGSTSVWDPSVRVFHLYDAGPAGALRAICYLDPYSRPANKRGGAWMDSFRDRLGARVPVAYLVCNQTPPVGDTPSLMPKSRSMTENHEFGHGLQHMLTDVDQPQAAGINGVEWDAVELPSQFMENWCFDLPTVQGFARHWQTGAPLPAELFAKVAAARTYRAGSTTLRQVYLATLDLELHHRMRPGEMPQDVQRRVAALNTVLSPLPEDRFLCSFSHIFAGGYAAGYYSYKWAEVLSADAFSAFSEAPAELQPEIGRRFRATVLARGGSQHPLEVFRDFRGRAPSVVPLLQQTGLA